MCKECSKKDRFKKDYRGIGELSGAHITRIKSALVRKTKTLAFRVSKTYLWKLFLKQDQRCALSDFPIILSKKISNTTASLDRIDSSKGYIKGNVQWIHKDINKMKMNFNQQYFIDTCKLIANNN